MKEAIYDNRLLYTCFPAIAHIASIICYAIEILLARYT